MQKYISLLVLSLFLLTQTTSNAQEGTKIPFDKGVLKICSSKNFIIKGHDGTEVIIKNLATGTEIRTLYSNLRGNLTKPSQLGGTLTRSGNLKGTLTKNFVSRDSLRIARFPSSRSTSRNTVISADTIKFYGNVKIKNTGPPLIGFLTSSQDKNRSKGLKKLGKKAAAEESGIYLKIEKQGDELTIKDDLENLFIMTGGEKYEISIPNSISLKWNTNGCTKSKSYFFNTSTSEIKNFNGEVEISSAVSNFKLIDVSGPVSVNTIGGNVTVEFLKTTPNNLYSIYSNNGFIDITLPRTSSIIRDANASEILSDVRCKLPFAPSYCKNITNYRLASDPLSLLGGINSKSFTSFNPISSHGIKNFTP